MEKSNEGYQNSDIVIMAAAISDYTPKSYSNKKLKESESKVFTIDLKKQMIFCIIWAN